MRFKFVPVIAQRLKYQLPILLLVAVYLGIAPAEDALHCGQVFDDDEQEALSLIQVNALRLKKAAWSNSSVAKANPDGARGGGAAGLASSSGTPRNETRLSEDLIEATAQVREGVFQVALHGAQTISDVAHLHLSQNTVKLIVFLLFFAVLALCVLGLLCIALRRSVRSSSIPEGFPRADNRGIPHSGEQVGSDFTPVPSHQAANIRFPGVLYSGEFLTDHVQGQAAYPPAPMQSAQTSQNQLPRVFTSNRSLPGSGRSLPRVQQYLRPSGNSRPGTNPAIAATPTLSLTPAESITKKVYYPTEESPLRPPEETSTPSASKRPPPLCPMLVLPHCESFFAVSIDQLVAGATSSEIMGLSGNALLRCNIRDSGGSRIIEVSMSPPLSPPLASIMAPSKSGPNVGVQEIKGNRDMHYGWLRPTNNCHVLTCGHEDVMTVVTNVNSGHCQLCAGSDGDVLARASRSADGEGIFAADDLEVRVIPGMDATLALLCIISAVIFNDFAFPVSRPFR